MSQTVLAIAAHADDVEFACGGTIHKLTRTGEAVYLLALATPAGVDADSFRLESRAAADILGIPEERVLRHGFEVRRLGENRQEVLDILLQVKRELAPEIVLAPSPSDVHQDHQIVHAEAVRAFKDRSLLGYEMPWNNIDVSNRLFVELAPEDVEKKVQAAACYGSQSDRRYTTRRYIEALAEVRGQQIGVPAAESFEPVRIIW